MDSRIIAPQDRCPKGILPGKIGVNCSDKHGTIRIRAQIGLHRRQVPKRSGDARSGQDLINQGQHNPSALPAAQAHHQAPPFTILHKLTMKTILLMDQRWWEGKSLRNGRRRWSRR